MPNKFITFLDKVGHDALAIITFGASVATKVEPEVDLALDLVGQAGVATLFNQVLALATAAQATANGVTGTGTQKLALVTAGITPLFEQFLTTNGVQMNTAQINAWVSLAVNLVMAIPTPTSPSTTVTPPVVTPVIATTKS